MRKYPDKTLLIAAKQGEISAFEAILYEFERLIFNYLYRLVGQRQDAEDLTQETFLKIYKNLGNVDPDGNFKAWLYRIATNTAYDWLRRKKRQGAVFFVGADQSVFETLDQQPAYKNMAAAEELAIKEDLEREFKKLRPLYKTVLTLFYREDLSYREIAKLLALPLNTVKTYLHRARNSLRENYRAPAS